jgi:mono/diheme cytochrome c family protein
MWNHWPAMSGAMQAIGMATPIFRKEELADVFAYLFISRYDAAGRNIDRGPAVYREKRCSSCHGARGEGGIGPALAGITTGKSKEEIASLMWNHAPQMGTHMGDRRIPWPRFTADDLAALIQFLSESWAPARLEQATLIGGFLPARSRPTSAMTASPTSVPA